VNNALNVWNGDETTGHYTKIAHDREVREAQCRLRRSILVVAVPATAAPTAIAVTTATASSATTTTTAAAVAAAVAPAAAVTSAGVTARVTSAAAAGIAAAITAAASSAAVTASLAGTGFVDGQSTALEILAVKAFDRLERFAVDFHFHETESAASTCLSIA
jgi:hypothetical protein